MADSNGKRRKVGPRLVDKQLILYGKGKLSALAEELFKSVGIPIYTKIDKDTPMREWERLRDGLIGVSVATVSDSHIRDKLYNVGFTDVVPVWDILEAYGVHTNIRNGWFADNITQIDKDMINFVYGEFEDDLSKMQYIDFVNWRIDRWDYKDVCYLEHECVSLPSTCQDIWNRQGIVTYPLPLRRELHIHCEGYERETINTNIDNFIKYRPTLSVACYHNRDALWAIPWTLMKTLKNYSFSFRLMAYQGQAAYVFCKPQK